MWRCSAAIDSAVARLGKARGRAVGRVDFFTARAFGLAAGVLLLAFANTDRPPPKPNWSCSDSADRALVFFFAIGATLQK